MKDFAEVILHYWPLIAGLATFGWFAAGRPIWSTLKAVRSIEGALSVHTQAMKAHVEADAMQFADADRRMGRMEKQLDDLVSR